MAKRGRKFKFSLDEMKSLVKEYTESGKSMIEFAKSKGLQKVTFQKYMAIVAVEEQKAISEIPTVPEVPVNA